MFAASDLLHSFRHIERVDKAFLSMIKLHVTGNLALILAAEEQLLRRWACNAYTVDAWQAVS